MTSGAAPKKISCDEARELVGRAFYGETWIKVSGEEDGLIGQYRLQPGRIVRDGTMLRTGEVVGPCSASALDRLVRAAGRHRIACAQIQTADNWLTIYGFDVARVAFDRATFTAALDGPMGEAIADLRRATLDNAQPAGGSTADLNTSMREAKSRAGAKAQHDWPKIEAECHRIMIARGDFSDSQGWYQAKLEEHLLQFCEDEFKRQPATATLRQRLPDMLDRWRSGSPPRA
jgi:hypothetical protein